MKYRILAALLIMTALVNILSGCGSNKGTCSMTVTVDYGGYDEGGMDLGSGQFFHHFSVRSGMVFYELDHGDWTDSKKDTNGSRICIELFKVTEVTPDHVTIRKGDKDITVPYDQSTYIEPGVYVTDAIGYDYHISFTDYSEGEGD
ncbi:MAG: hypothetical protein J6S95_04335 [Lachnospiraceae bacterium]|nr:hypothetical protein [Lachnospiraceae bacterium]